MTTTTKKSAAQLRDELAQVEAREQAAAEEQARAAQAERVAGARRMLSGYAAAEATLEAEEQAANDRVTAGLDALDWQACVTAQADALGARAGRRALRDRFNNALEVVADADARAAAEAEADPAKRESRAALARAAVPSPRAELKEWPHDLAGRFNSALARSQAVRDGGARGEDMADEIERGD